MLHPPESDDSDDLSPSSIVTRRIPSADDVLTLRVRHHSPCMREFIVTSNAPLLTPIDLLPVLLPLFGLLLRFLALPAIVVESITAVPLLLLLFPLLLLAAMKAQTVTSESLLCVSSLGLTLCTRYVTGREVRRFVDSSAVEAVVINEGVEGWRVVDALCVVVRRREGEAGEGWVDGRRVQLVFGQLRPRLCTLRKVYRGVRAVLYNEIVDRYPLLPPPPPPHSHGTQTPPWWALQAAHTHSIIPPRFCTPSALDTTAERCRPHKPHRRGAAIPMMAATGDDDERETLAYSERAIPPITEPTNDDKDTISDPL